MMAKILLCTVGGTYQPIIQAVEQLNPDLTVFVCSEGPSSSESMITGQGKVIKADKNDEKPSLPNIPTQLGLGRELYKTIQVSPDDLDAVVRSLNAEIAEIKKDYPQAELFADYTGGTKTMTAGLILAALDHDIQLQLVKGARTDLEKVANGTQWGVPASVDWVRFSRTLKNNLSAWKQYAYGQAVAGLEGMQVSGDSSLQQEFIKAKTISQAFDAWDRFDHSQARKLLSIYRAEVAPEYVLYFKVLDVFCQEKNKAREPALIYDLWLNAWRRAVQGRYDDAVARVYRIVEWTAQWALSAHCKVDTADLPEDFIPQEVTIYKNRDGKYQAPLYQAWLLLRYKGHGPLARFIQDNEKGLLTFLNLRNQSILAHGKSPVTKERWGEARGWFEENILPPFLQELKSAGLKEPPPQLPVSYKWV